MKRNLIKHFFQVIFLVFIIGVFVAGCNSTSSTDTTIITTSPTTTTMTQTEETTTINNVVYTIDDVRERLIECKERIEEIIFSEYPEFAEEMGFVQSYSDLPDGVEKHTREELLSVRNASGLPDMFGGYSEFLFEVEMFVDEFIEILTDNDSIRIGVPYYPDLEESSMYYVFDMSNDNYVLVQIAFEYGNEFMKIGFTDGLLDLREVMYAYNLESDFIHIEDSVYYNYMSFTEDQECIYMNSIDNSVSITYTSIADQRYFSASFDSEFAEDIGESGYNLNAYDAENNVNYYLNVQDDFIVGETYTVYNEHGFLYNYSDYDISDDEIRLYIDFVEADGWDYILSSNFQNSDEIEAASGIFLDDDTQLYSGSVYCNVNEYYVSAQLRRTLSPEELTNDVLKLTDYGIYLDDDRASLAFLNSIKITDINDVKDDFIIEGLNIFAENKRLELYNFLDEDVKAVFTHVDEPVETTGDVAEFNQSLAYFNAEFQNTLQISVKQTSVMTITYDGNSESSYTYSGYDCDYNDFYYREYFKEGHFGYDTTMLLPYEDKLIEFTSNSHVTSYSTIADVVSEENFYNYIQQKLDLNSNDYTAGMISVEKQDEFTYFIVLDKSFLSTTIDMNQVFEQQGISGLNDASMSAVITFASDYQSYSMEISITGLYLTDEPDFEIVVSNSITASCSNFTKVDPMNLANTLQLPDNQSDIIIDTPSDILVSFYTSDSGSSWVRMELNEGYYIARIGAEFNIYDTDGNLIENDYYLIIENAGTYYFELLTDYSQIVDFDVFKVPDRNLVEYVLNASQGHLTLVKETEDTDYTFTVPVGENDRLVRFDLPDIDLSGTIFGFWADEFLNGATWGKTYEGEAISIYFYIPAGESLDIAGSGPYIGTIEMDYEIFDVPIDTGSMPVYESETIDDLPDVILTPEIGEARLDFTVTEAGEYNFVFEFYNFGMAQVTCDLYSSDGILIMSDWGYRWSNLAVGDYYVIFHYEDYEPNLVVIVSEIIKD